MRKYFSALCLVLAACGGMPPESTQAESVSTPSGEAAPAVVEAPSGPATDRVDILVNELDKARIVTVLNTVPGFSGDSCFAAVGGGEFAFVPEVISGPENATQALAVEALVKYLLTHP